MELSGKEWWIIIGVLLIVAVLLDGYRRVRSERSNRIRVTLTKQAMQRGMHSTSSSDVIDDKAPEISSELPNGGARVIAKARRDDISHREDLKLDEAVPVLMESVHIAPLDEKIIAPEPVEADLRTTVTDVEALATTTDVVDEPVYDAKTPEPYLTETALDDEPVAEREQRWDREQERPAEPVAQVEAPSERYVETRTLQNASLPNSSAQEVMIVNVISRDPSGFKGQDLLQILLACDLRFGSMNIFHRYEKANGKGAVQFSVANLVEPGTFDLDRIDSLSTPGLCFFLTLPGPEKAITAFNYMVETAQVLVKNLQGELRDEGQSVMTQQTIEHCRQRIRDFERKQLTLHL